MWKTIISHLFAPVRTCSHLFKNGVYGICEFCVKNRYFCIFSD